jgi:hypothetical protein
MRFRLRTLLTVLALGPPLLVAGYRECYRLERCYRQRLVDLVLVVPALSLEADNSDVRLASVGRSQSGLGIRG